MHAPAPSAERDEFSNRNPKTRISSSPANSPARAFLGPSIIPSSIVDNAWTTLVTGGRA